ncbi:p21-activated protein kinase-interacting protein 1-like protein [Tyrophagus putrescentiae]|nr:p21-activated protein kinase-interacting protein 1-like protein [Tyrophagus putrescentiae]
MEVVIGSYEEYLVGFLLQKTTEDDKPAYNLKRSFTNKAHEGSVRAVAHSWKYLVSGGVDEVIHIISMKHRIDAGTLVGAHSGTITALEFLRSAYLFSGSEDGTIAIWNSRKGWALEKVLRGHREGVTSLSVHASGKLLLSVSARDRTLRTWNLVKGRCAYVINLKTPGAASPPQQVVWSPSGAYFAVLYEHRLDVYDLGTGGVAHSVEKEAEPILLRKAPQQAFFLVFRLLFNRFPFALPTRTTRCSSAATAPTCWSTTCRRAQVVNRATLHANRIKDMSLLVDVKATLHPDLKDESMLPKELWLVTASSDGYVQISSYDGDNLSAEPQTVDKVHTACRPTCMTVWTSSQDRKFDDFVVPKLKLPHEQLLDIKNRFAALRKKLTDHLGMTDRPVDGGGRNPIADLIAGRLGRVQEANEKRQQQRVKKFTTRVPVAEMKSGRETGKRNGHSTTSSPSPNRKPFKNQQNRQPQEKQRPRNKKFTTRVPVAEMNNNKKQSPANRGANNNNKQQQQKRSFKGGNKKFTTKVRVSEMSSGGGGKGGFKPRNKNRN